ncbi:MAG: hypothetical protein P1U74_07870 [Legionellaceae bacterium]|nr:hypothetical protein [Legionellaceae bacterium]
MSFKKILRYIIIPMLTIGASITLGFLGFSGIYVLAPIISLAIGAFFLSVGFEYEIYYQNIKSALDSLFKSKYLERQLAKECLREELRAIEEETKEFEDQRPKENLTILLDELFKKLLTNNSSYKYRDGIIEDYKKILAMREKCQQRYPGIKFIELPSLVKFKSKIYSSKYVFFANKLDSSMSFKKDFVPFITFLDSKVPNSPTVEHPLEKRPQFFTDYLRAITTDHQHAHLNLDKEDKQRKQKIEASLNILEKTYAEQLFRDSNPQSKDASPQEIQRPIGEEKQSSEGLTEEDTTRRSKEYKEELYNYIKKKYQKEYTDKLPRRRILTNAAKITGTICGLFMMLGTSYLLVEAFSVVPIIATIPLGIWPVIIIPMSVIAGAAFGLLTYNALDELIHHDMIMKRFRKIKEDWNNGLNLYTGLKLLVFASLLTLAITLTVFTGGTWWTVMKHTRPVFSWLSKMPSAVIAIGVAFLGVAALAFNLSNSIQTSEELEEVLEAETSDSSFHIDLVAAENIDSVKDLSKRPTIIATKDGYYIYGCLSQDENARDIKGNWGMVKVVNNAYFSRMILYFMNFNKDRLNFNIFNALVYLTVKLNKAHTFVPSRENYWQFFNPFRILLLLTYAPMKAILFLGHLISISATADRIPGVNEIIAMLVGFVAELFEDLHYFMSFEHTHKQDVDSLLDERYSNGGGHNHESDLPTRTLRALFYPVFYLSAWWHVSFKDEQLPSRILHNYILYPFVAIYNIFSVAVSGNNHASSAGIISANDSGPDLRPAPIYSQIEFENALNRSMGKQEITSVEIDPSEQDFVTELTKSVDESSKAADINDDEYDGLEDTKEGEEILLSKLSILAERTPREVRSRIHISCSCHQPGRAM